ncbi:uncharacterized protein isoform X1 [Leptinotarsa decemlineata]|uniref:uncharacterized protein isoform X1 n=1 Tax=Leptinotarsa decemlineata TaxID=7539 RepID=UPI003D30C91E
MSALAPMVINSLLGNHISGAVKPDLPSTVTEKTAASSKIVRKHYNDGGYYPHEGYHNQEGYHPHEEGYENGGHTYIHHYSGGGNYGKKKSRSVALTALTLLAFLFFLHILQSCLDQTMPTTTTTTTAAPQIVIMQAKLKAARESTEKLAKEASEAVEEVGEAQKGVPEVQNKRAGELPKKKGVAQKRTGETQHKLNEAERRVDILPEVFTESTRWTTRSTTKRHIAPSVFTEGTDLYRYEKVPMKMKLIENYRRP